MKNSILLSVFGLAVISASSVLADTATFNFTTTIPTGQTDDNNQAPSLTFGAASSTGVLNGVTVTATAYATTTATTNSAVNGQSGNAELGQYGGDGLGVCSVGDSGYSKTNPSAGCNDPAHQVDNSGDYEFILFTFSTAVNLNNITLANFGTTGSDAGTIDMDMSYWINVGVTPGTTTVSNLGTPTGNDFCGDSSEPGNQACPAHYYDTTGGTSLTDTLNGSNVTTLLVAAYVGSTSSPADSNPDFFKVQSMNINKTGATPEPATFGMFGLALAGLGWYARKRKLS